MEKEVILWLGLLIVFLVIEITTVGLTTIWPAGGALVALLLYLAGFNIWWQTGAFLLVTFLLLFFTRPFAVKYINSHHEKTNYEGVVNGLEWTTRSVKDGEILEPGELAKVINISGVKLIVEKYEEE